MDTTEKAQEFLRQLSQYRANSLFEKMDESKRGMGFALLFLDSSEEQIFAGDLADAMCVSTARVAALLKTMENGGFITRSSSSKDARRTIVELTPEGQAKADAIKALLLHKTEMLFETVGEDDLREFLRISKRIKEALDL